MNKKDMNYFYNVRHEIITTILAGIFMLSTMLLISVKASWVFIIYSLVSTIILTIAMFYYGYKVNKFE